MKISCTSIALLFTSTLFGGASAFGIAPITASTTTSSSSISSSSAAKTTTALNYKPQHFDRAVECATTVGECDLDELESLANGELSDWLTAELQKNVLGMYLFSFAFVSANSYLTFT